jgi:hypothetical protein
MMALYKILMAMKSMLHESVILSVADAESVKAICCVQETFFVKKFVGYIRLRIQFIL